MGNKPTQQPTVHTRINSERALCGSTHNVVSFREFFAHDDDEMCGRCRQIVERRGYSIARERQRRMESANLYQQASNGGLDARA